MKKQEQNHNGNTPGVADSSFQTWVFNEIMDRMSANIYVTDIETDEVLFMNKTMRNTFAIENPEGKQCWKILQKDQTQRCSFCPVPILQACKSQASSFVWEQENAINGRIYENYDSLMPWVDGRTVHFQYSIDVTETKKLYRAATLDDLTGVFNRRAGKGRLENTIDCCFLRKIPLTICMIDVNDLKMVNDTYGHPSGDELLVTVACAIQKILEGEDYLFRLSGDEFLAVLVGKNKKTVVQLMNDVLWDLRERNLYPGLKREREFCFGVIEMTPGNQFSTKEFLSFVDGQLYEQKRLFHIQQAQKALKNQRDRKQDSKIFTYDTELLYDALAQSTDDYVYVCNMKTGVFRYPPAMVEEFDLPGTIIKNAVAVWGAKIHENDKMAFLESNQEIIDGRTDSHSIEYRAKNRNGEWVWMRCRGHLERDENGAPSLFAGIITNLGKKNKVDPLTGLFNKFEFENMVRHLVENRSSPLMVLLFGIDNLKRINHRYSRRFGDEVVRVISQKIQSLLPSNASVFRLDGDEFGVIFRNGTMEQANTLFESLQKAFYHHQFYESKKFFCSLSCGCVLFDSDDIPYLELIKRASYALDYSKKKGKNQMKVFSSDILGQVDRSFELTDFLHESMERNFAGFEVYFQPIFNSDGTLHGAEALARWSCEKYGMIPPGEFIPLMEENGMILQAGQWIFQQAVRFCKQFLERKPDMVVGVNISCLQFEDSALLTFIQDTLEQEGVSPSHIVIELTESYLTMNLHELAELLVQIREIGIQVAMDDFGTGYSSLSILKNAPIDVVKIDKSFVEEIDNNAFNSSFIRMVVELCHNVGIEVCVEGIELEIQHKALEPMQVDYFQGFFFGFPVSAEEFKRQVLGNL